MNKYFIINIIKVFTISLSIVIFSKCANPRGITGGAKDTTAPKPVVMIPMYGTKNFKGKEVVLEFNEWVNTQNIKNELIITPEPKGNYTVKENKNVVRLVFEENFEENTTYTFNFRKGIVDINEKNIADSSNVVFSTGDYLDSLRISGTLINMEKKKPYDNATIGLYIKTDTLDITKEKPLYLTKTNAQGGYEFQNIKNGKYLIYAFTDKNNTGKFNPKKDEIAFLSDEINLDNNIDTLQLELYKDDNRKPKLTRAKATVGKKTVTLEFDEGIKSIELDSNSSQYVKAYIESTGDKVQLYKLQEISDTLQVILTATDSSANVLVDTAKIKFDDKYDKQVDLTLATKPEDKTYQNQNFELVLKFNKPISIFEDAKIYYQIDGDSIIKYPLIDSSTQIVKDLNQGNIKIKKKINFKENISVTVDTAAIISVENDTLVGRTFSYKFRGKDKYGKLDLEIQTNKQYFIIQLLDDKFNVIREHRNQQLISYEYLRAGKYLIRAIIDENNDGKWNGGDYQKRKQPEKMIIFNKELEIRENWEIRENFKF